MNNLIYAFVDEDNIPFYIGKTVNLKRRKKRHINDAKNGGKLHLHCKLRKLISENKIFEVMIIEDNVDNESIDEREIYWIKHYRQKYNLCNIANGGEGSKGMSPAMQKAASEKRKGIKRSEETRKKMSAWQIGRKFSKEHREKLCIARRKRIIKPETRLKLSKTSKGKINIKKYKLIDPQGNEHITTNGLKLFCEQNNLTVANLHKVLKGTRNHHKGWKIEYANN